ncbi:MAG: helix-turn-helix domain-containing protein [Elusimicrobiota bacterium]
MAKREAAMRLEAAENRREENHAKKFSALPAGASKTKRVTGQKSHKKSALPNSGKGRSYPIQRFSPGRTKRGTLKTVVNIDGILPPDLRTASLGEKIRYVRRRLGLSCKELARRAGIGNNTLTRLERGEGKAIDAVVGRVLRALGPALAEAFPGTQDIFDLLFPSTSFGDWLRNFRLRRGLQQRELAEILGLNKVSVCRYEKNIVKPQEAILKRLRRKFNLNGEFERYL